MGQEHELRVAIIGAGMAGIMSAIRLEETGFTDVVVYEKADRIGGTWRENTYPGIACDVPSHLYSYSFRPNPEWSHRYSPGQEIQAYFEQVAAERGLDRRIRFGEEVTQCHFTGGRWQLETSSGSRDLADVVIAATGVLHHPNLPDIPGLDTFGGTAMHSARWDGDVSIDGRRLGVIGTGSTAIQITAATVHRVSHLSLFQRTPQWVAPMENPAYTEGQKAELRRDPSLARRRHDDLSATFSGFANALVDADSPQMAMIEEMCRTHLEEKVRDPELRERLRPDYRAGCKRLVISGDFYDAIQRPNAELVTSQIERVEQDGVRTKDGRLHRLDVLVLATGFRVDQFMRPMQVRGRDGVSLEDAWADRPKAYLSVSIPGFPNLFMLNGPNGPVGNFSLIEVAELQMAYILQLVDHLRSGRYREISASPAAMERFEHERAQAAQRTIWITGCRSWYLDDRGVPAVWPWTFDQFRTEMRAPNFDHYDVRA
ncbi:MAG TPA: NAD(P)/FAD-dependent oxidoreductase [Acidimicrobiales bacterium]|nr:NAD(P)/FAD-dependent oxidoreductase [Acidimicrobiales bacterium]